MRLARHPTRSPRPAVRAGARAVARDDARAACTARCTARSRRMRTPAAQPMQARRRRHARPRPGRALRRAHATPIAGCTTSCPTARPRSACRRSCCRSCCRRPPSPFSRAKHSPAGSRCSTRAARLPLAESALPCRLLRPPCGPRPVCPSIQRVFQHVIPFSGATPSALPFFPLLSCAAWAQADPPPPALREVTVTGNPLGATDLIAPTTTLSGDALLLRSQSTLGETLNGLPGVSSTYFGPNASRPIDPRPGRRPHPHPAERRRGARRLGAELRPRGAGRRAGHRAHRGAARPVGAAVRRQRGRRRGQRDRQPHPERAASTASAAAPTSATPPATARRAAAWCSKAATTAMRCTWMPSTATPTTSRCRSTSACEKPAPARPGAQDLQLGQRGARRRGRRHAVLRPGLDRRFGQHLPQQLRHGGRGRRHHRHEVRPLCARRRMAAGRLLHQRPRQAEPHRLPPHRVRRRRDRHRVHQQEQRPAHRGAPPEDRRPRGPDRLHAARASDFSADGEEAFAPHSRTRAQRAVPARGAAAPRGAA